MKALSIKQPWASLICSPGIDNPKLGIKPVENRTWATKIRERVYIHASAKFAGDVNSLFTDEQWRDMGEEMRCRMVIKDFPFSAIIGEVDILDCVTNHPSIWADKTYPYQLAPEEVSEDYPKPIYNWVLANPVMYDEPILNVKGKLSFWEFEKGENND